MSCSPPSRKRPNLGDDNSKPFNLTLANGRLKRGVLNILPSLPLDILCEIFCFLHLVDLFVLARISKAFHCFLLKRSSAFIWRSSRRKIDGLPDPPSDMTEVRYASLVFGSRCYYEGCDRKARDTVWHLRIRSCATCRPKHQPIKIKQSGHCSSIYGIPDGFPDALGQYIPCGPFLNSKGNSVKGFQESHIKEFMDDLKALPASEHQSYLDRRKQATEIINQVSVCITTVPEQDLIEFQFAQAGVAWQLSAKDAHITELRNKRAARAEILRDSLVAAGFGEEVDHFGWDRIRKHSLISSTQPMTDQARYSVLDQLREYMLGWRELRLEEQIYAFRRRIFVEAWIQFTTTIFISAPSDLPHFPLPPSATIGFSEIIDPIIRQSATTSHESILDQLHAAFPRIYEYIIEWHESTRRELASLLLDYDASDDDEAIHTRLKLATSVFHCSGGRNCRAAGRTLTYREILFHPCFTNLTSGNAPSPKDPRGIANQKASLMMGSSPWKCSGRVQVHPRQDVVHKILLCCGQDPRSTTAAEMDKQDPRLACLECAIHDKVVTFMSWRRAVQHNVTHHPNFSFNPPWLMANHATRARINMLESPSLRQLPSVLGDALGDYSICLHCPPRIPSWSTRFGFGELMSHFMNKHGISSPVFGIDYAFDTNITPVYPDPLNSFQDAMLLRGTVLFYAMFSSFTVYFKLN
ncbi:hypothetical protein JVU11DRAFT_651 [Chiua virens]|nr:hypothetical protein JVU11DRAFT_651 [Chiua virens]